MGTDRADPTLTGAFKLDAIENPHPEMLDDALQTRARAVNRPWDDVTAAEWRGYLRGMCRATGCTEADLNAWLDRHAEARWQSRKA